LIRSVVEKAEKPVTIPGMTYRQELEYAMTGSLWRHVFVDLLG
jgi:hypothetical protein